MGGKRRKFKDIPEFVQHDQIIEKLKLIQNPRDRALGCTLYGTAARIGEIVRNDALKHNGVTKPQVVLKDVDGIKALVFFKIPCLKRRDGLHYRNIPIPYDDNHKWLCDEIMTYRDSCPTKDLFNISRQRAWKIVNKELGFFNHYFRHLRNSMLVEKFGFTPGDLKEYNGWATTEPADEYTHLNWMRILKKMEE